MSRKRERERERDGEKEIERERERDGEKGSLDESGRHGHVSASSEDDGEEGDEDDGIAVAPWSPPSLLKSAMADRGSRAEPSLNLRAVAAVFADKLQHGRVAGLPVYKGDPRHEKKSRAGSVKASGLQDWLNSAEGLEWQATKHRCHGQAKRASGVRSAHGWMDFYGPLMGGA